MISFAKIVGDLFGGYVVHIAGAIGAIVLAGEAASTLKAFVAPVVAALH